MYIKPQIISCAVNSICEIFHVSVMSIRHVYEDSTLAKWETKVRLNSWSYIKLISKIKYRH